MNEQEFKEDFEKQLRENRADEYGRALSGCMGCSMIIGAIAMAIFIAFIIYKETR